MDEFALIREFFAPLSRGFDGGLGLTDDAAILPCSNEVDFIVTKDALSEGVHFIGTESPRLLAQKALRVNLSDLAAMGAKPMAYLLAVMLPHHVDSAWVAEFARGLQEDQDTFGIYLAGGDTIATKGPLTFSITAIGTAPAGKALRRSHAQAGDRIFVTGTLGDSALGLELLHRKINIAMQKEARQFLESRYFLPEPRVAAGQRLISLATSCMDISDGLVQDMSHICRASETGAVMEIQKLPLSSAARTLVQEDASLWPAIFSGGDDYELLFTVPEARVPEVASLADELKLPMTDIGHMKAESGATLLDDRGKPVKIDAPGFRHFVT